MLRTRDIEAKPQSWIPTRRHSIWTVAATEVVSVKNKFWWKKSDIYKPSARQINQSTALNAYTRPSKSFSAVDEYTRRCLIFITHLARDFSN